MAMSKEEIGFDTALEVCGDRHRRIVLAMLAEEGRALTVRDLAQAIIRYGHDLQPDEVDGEVYANAQAGLHHRHLPKLTKAGVIDYDRKRHLVEPADQLDQLWPSLSTIIALDQELSLPLEL